MPGWNLDHLGNLVLSARKRCGLTQKELAKQTGLSVKTIQDTEKGRKRPGYRTLARLTERLGIPPNEIFQSQVVISTDNMQPFLESFHLCDPQSQEILLRTMHFSQLYFVAYSLAHFTVFLNQRRIKIAFHRQVANLYQAQHGRDAGNY